MFTFIPSLVLILLLAFPGLLTTSTPQELQVGGHRTPRDTSLNSIKVVISDGCATQGDSSDVNQGGKEIDLAPGSPLVLTHKIKLVPSTSGSGSGSCGCEADFAALRERLERLEREVSALREKCGGADGGCCTSKESKGAGCSFSSGDECPNECSDQGRCVDGKCVCFPGYSGLDCSETSCPANCNDNGRCVNGKCVCDPGFSGPDCSQRSCPDNCNDRGKCVNGKCVCNSGFMGPSCLDESCPGNCNNRGRCVNGQCVCSSGFTGPDCSEQACPGNCNNRGHCINGQCICDNGFTGPDCSERTCPNDCSDHGRCVNGKCVCDSGFTGDDCSENSCPSKCNNRGRCVNGQCVCNEGFAGADCSQKTCINNCSNQGKCVNGKCVCNVGFAGPDCSVKSCPNNCNNKGRCVKGKCVCRRGFTGQDCSQCEEGRTGPNCDTVMSGVSPLSTRDITETSVTLDWTPPAVQYDSYHITFTSQKESDQQISVQVEGSLTSFTQTGLAAGQEYSVTIRGELDGRRGAGSSTNFTTLISGPTNLQVVKTTTTSAVVQWEKSQGDIDRYRLTVTPRDGAGRSQEMTIPANQNSAHIQDLEAGHLYDIILVAEKGRSQSKPLTTQAVPGKTLPRVTATALNMQVTLAPGQDVGNAEDKADSVKAGGIDGPNKDYSTSIIARTKPLVSRIKATDGDEVIHAVRPSLSKKPNIPGNFRFNANRFVPKGRKEGSGPLTQTRTPIVPRRPKPVVSKVGHKSTATVSHPSVEASSSKKKDDKDTAIIARTDSETNRQRSLEELAQPPTAGMAENDTLHLSEPNGTVHSTEKKCMNRIKVTHIKLPLKDRGRGCRGDGTVVENTDQDSDQGFPEINGLHPHRTSDPDYSPDPLHKLLTDTFDSLNITMFSVHLSKLSNLSEDTETGRKQILSGLKPLPSFSSLSSSSTSKSSHSHSSPSLFSATQSLSMPSSSLSLASPSQVSSSSTTAPTQTHFIPTSTTSSPLSTSSLSASLPSSPFSSNTDKSVSVELSELVDDNNPSTTTTTPKHRKLLPSSKGGASSFRQILPKRGYVRQSPPKLGYFQNKAHLNLRMPQRSSIPLSTMSSRETETRRTRTNEFPSLSASSLAEVNVPVKGASEDGITTPVTPVRQFSRKGGYMSRLFPNVSPLRNRTQPNMKLMTSPSRLLNPKTKTQKEQVSSTELPATLSALVLKDSFSAVPAGQEKDDTYGTKILRTSISTKLNKTLRGSGMPFSHQPATNVRTFHHTQRYGTPYKNNKHLKMSPPQHPHRGLIRRKLPPTKINGVSSITFGSPSSQLRNDSSLEIPAEQEVPRSTQEVKTRQSEGKKSGQMESHDATLRLQKNELEKLDNPLIQITKFQEEESSTPDSRFDSDIKKGTADARQNTGHAYQGRPNVKQSSSVTRASRPVTFPKKQPSTTSMTAQHQTQMRHFSRGSQRGEDPKLNQTARRVFETKPKHTINIASKPVKGPHVSSGVTREPLEYVGVTNRTSDGFTLIWESPEGKYKNFVVTTKEAVKGSKDQQGEQDDFENQGGKKEQESEYQPIRETENVSNEDENRLPQSVATHIPSKQSNTTVKPARERDKALTKLLPGSSRSLQFEDLFPQTEYTITLLGKGPGLLSRLHKLVISTGPEPPSNVVFSKVTENSLTVSWTKPKSPVSGFKVTYTHAEDGEPMSVSVDSEDSTLNLSKLLPGSSYEVSVISTLGLDESDPAKESVTTLPDPPRDFQAVNVTDNKALLLWRPALAAIDKYNIVYGSGTGSQIRISVSGNTAEQQLSGLEGSTTYTVTITSQLDGLESSPATTTFTTTSGKDEDVPRDLQANNVTPHTALLTWKPPSNPIGSYRLTYQTEGQEIKEVIVDASLTEYNLTRLYPGSKYTAQLQAENGGRYMSGISTEFTTGTQRFPFPTDCSQEMLNGIRTSGKVEVFPQGKFGKSLMVYCDMDTEGGGWTVFQRRKDGSVDFFRGWKEYVEGFGDLNGEFWLGLENLHNLTALTTMSLRVDLRDGDESVFAKYSTFSVAKRSYKLTVGGYSGTAGDSLSYHNNRAFSTKDRDPAQFITRCAMSYRGGWWYKNCHEANLNGLYGMSVKHQGVIWTSWKGKDISIPFTEMKMRPAAFSPPTRG